MRIAFTPFNPFTAFAAAILIAACSSGKLSPFGSSRLDVLTNFTLAVSRGDSAAALEMMAPEERMRFLTGGGLTAENRWDRLRAMRLSTLNQNPGITLQDGRLKGLYGFLPVLEAGPMTEISRLPVDEIEDVKPSGPSEDELLRQATEALFQSIRKREWDRALGYLNPREKRVFLDEKGGLRKSALKRLSAIDTASWNALALRDGKLTGVVLIIPSPLDSRSN
jgi:hypothetical protein